MTETYTATIEVHHDGEEIIAILSERDIPTVSDSHDLPDNHLDSIQDWAEETFSDLESGESIMNAGKLVYSSDNIFKIEKTD